MSHRGDKRRYKQYPKEFEGEAVAFFEKNEVKYHFIQDNAQDYTVGVVCRVMKVEKSAFSAWKARPAQLITASEIHMYRRI